MTPPPLVAVTATTEIIRSVPRTRANVAYTAAVQLAGGRPVILPLLDAGAATGALDGLDALLLTGGEDVSPACYGAPPHPALGAVLAERDDFELALLAAARRRRLPVLAVCRGLQVANVAFGGSLVQDLASERPDSFPHDGDARSERIHPVTLAPGSRLAEALGATAVHVNSLHHQAVERLGEGLSATAHAPDGVIEGIEWTEDEWWLLGVQWHPEELTTTPERWDRALFEAFVRTASATAATAPHW